MQDLTPFFSVADLALAEELARRAAVAIENARLYHAAHAAQEALQQANTDLERRVEERTAALHHAMAERQRLEHEAFQAKHFALLGRLAAGVSHEIRNPLGAVFLHVDLLAEELAQPSSDSTETIAETLAEIRTNLARVEDLVQDYLALVRVSTLQRDVQDLGVAVQAWGTEFQRQAMAHGVTLQLNGVAALGLVAFHANSLHRALLNLVHNALEAMPQGGTLTLAGCSRPDQVQIAVCDTGSGIAAERLTQIFEPLYTTKPGGTGLGLYIVQEILRAHGGQVTVTSQMDGTGDDLYPDAAPRCRPYAGSGDVSAPQSSQQWQEKYTASGRRGAACCAPIPQGYRLAQDSCRAEARPTVHFPGRCSPPCRSGFSPNLPSTGSECYETNI